MLNKIIKKIFYFMGSVKLAVPALLTFAVVIAVGTIIESRYNADYARLLIYKNPLFSTLLILIWISVLFATLTRLPWKRHHIGFLITHLGLLLLFAGGFLTNNLGVDGILRVVEGQSSREVVINDIVVSARAGNDPQAVEFEIPRSMFEKGESSFSSINEALRGLAVVRGYLPFAEVREVLKEKNSSEMREPFEVQFRIKSAFFNVVQGLNSQSQTQLQMGPATFRLLKMEKSPRKPNSVTSSAHPAGSSVLNLKVGSTEKHIDLNHTKVSVVNIGSYKVKIAALMGHATVVNNGLQDNPQGPINPALVLEISDGKETAKEVLFAKFPTFSLRKGKFADLQITFVAGDTPAASVSNDEGRAQHGGSAAESFETAVEHSAQANAAPMAGGSGSGPDGNEVKMFYSPADPQRVFIELWKAGKKVTEKSIAQGESFQTPWMGMELTVEKIAWNAEKEIQVVPTTPVEKMDQLPPSAIKVGRYDGAPSEERWMPEGEEWGFNVDGKEYLIYYGRKILTLPFTVELKSFKKTEYPGTNTAKEFESHINVSGQFLPTTISMNEPLNLKGYTIYQSSYEALPNGQYASIFSVNKDPGRPFKYLGGIILAIGIITYTITKSRRFKNMRSKA